MGDVSITRPSSFTNSDRTSSSCRRLSAVRSTSKLRQVPNPITGSFSPDEGIARTNILDDSFAARASDAPIGRSKLAVLAPINRAASRRVIGFIFVFVMSNGDEISPIVGQMIVGDSSVRAGLAYRSER